MIEVPLNHEARAYFNEHLADSSGISGRLSVIMSQSGTIFGIVPEGTTVDRARRVEAGGLFPVVRVLQLEDSRLEQIDTLSRARWLFAEIKRISKGTLVLQDIWALPSDASENPKGAQPYFIEGQSVYYYRSAAGISFDDLNAFIKHPVSWMFPIFLVEHEIGGIEVPPDDHIVLPGFTEKLLPLVTTCYLNAYDRESWVVWRR